ncbi:uncharacterized protein LOC132602326 [Lycium barbarum]|uniref:uncharacterized protein LOC132602326 n=1 Tax=Lycium barbarum TaxID=112863 RepID=UPI00293F1943|nr:uncharacterized protein LOC132602326 [Lycium barbarum]
MAIGMISEAPSIVTSPRVSFSDDLCNKDANAVIEDFQHQSDHSNSDFDFCINNNTNTETSSADELFLDGLIRPLQLQEKFVTLNQQVPLSKSTQTLSSPQNKPTPNEILKQNVVTTTRRSSSLHCVNGNKKSSFWSLPLLSRSNSTGSAPNPKNSTKEGHKQNAQFKQMKNMNFPSSQKPPLRKNYGHGGLSYGNGVSVNPVLNVPPTFIPKGTANLFGLGSFFANGKEKKSKK